MIIKIGLGNSVTTTLDVTAKTLTFTGAYNFDLNEGGLSVWNTTRSAFMIVGQIVTGSGTILDPYVYPPVRTESYVGGLIVQTLTLSSIPAGAANGDVLVITCDCPDDVAIYNATVATI